MNEKHPFSEEIQEQIAAYCDGEMTPEERSAFEERIEKDENLRSEVDRWLDAVGAAKDWMHLDAPGVERVEALPIPTVSKRSSAWFGSLFGLYLPRYTAAACAALVIFLSGYFAGVMSQSSVVPSIQESTVKEAVTPTPSESDAPIQLAHLPDTYRASQENGRVVIETTLKGVGTRALWVVDGKFRLEED